MQVGERYIMEIEEVIRRNGAPQIARIKGFNALVFDKYGLEKLEPYEDKSDAYDKGLIDAWETVRKIIENVVDGGYSSDVLREIFGTSTVQSIFTLNNAAEAIAKIKAYEEQQKQNAEIKVGDEIVSGKSHVVVTYISPEGEWNGFSLNKTEYGEQGQGYTCMSNFNGWRKTYRHFPQIAEVLSAWRGEE